MNKQAEQVYKDVAGDRDKFIMRMVSLDYTLTQARDLFLELHPQEIKLTKIEQARAFFDEVDGDFLKFRNKVLECELLTDNGAKVYWQNFAGERRFQQGVKDAKAVATDFKVYISSLEQSDLVALVTNLIHDADGLDTKTMRSIMQRSGVKDYQ